MFRREVEVTSTWSLKLALYNHLINGLESVIAEYECTDVSVVLPESYESQKLSELIVCYTGCSEAPYEGFELDNIVRYELADRYEFKQCYEGLRLSELYSQALDLYLRNVPSYLRSYSIRTALEGIEYMLVVLQNGRAVLLEGERNKIVIPSVKTVASAHTHPKNCIPSPHDIRSLTNILLDGGLGASIISPNCILTIFRNGPFTEDDYLALTSLIKNLRRNPIDELGQLLARGVLGKNLRIMMHH
ncbi:MAG: hypothetical protein J7L12_02180 [Desulfurococcales archaeon]|nr:hypothetical protein [Desulfurococcales archaeon]